MDLKSMLNDSSTQRHQHHHPHHPPQPHPPPRLHTPQSSYEHTASYEAHPALERPPLPPSASSYHQPQPQPPPSNEYRTSANGSYFPVQSPQQQHSASASGSTPSATGQSFYAQSPGPHGQIHTPREGIPPSHPYQSPFVPSPSPSGPYPPTPGSVHHYQTVTPSSATTYHQSSAHPSLSAQSPTLRDDYISANGLAHAQQRHVSPQAQFHPPPVTPLGPPVAYPRPSPHPHRPTSHGHESVRRSSVGSVGSVQSREYNQAYLPQAEHSRSASGSIQRTYSGDLRERERSIESVSPKTIPKPAPGRQQSVGRHQELMSDPNAQPNRASIPQTQFHTTPDRGSENHSHETTPKSFSASIEPRPGPPYPDARPSPGPGASNHYNSTPQQSHSSLSAKQSPVVHAQPQPSLKRSASHLSDVATTPLPPKKRPRRDEVPIWAQSARRNLPLKFGEPANWSPPRQAVTPKTPGTPRNDVPVKKGSVSSQAVNGQVRHTATPSGEPGWEPSITGEAAYDDLARRVCDWIYLVIGNAEPPAGGAMFEIEAKVGMIFDEQASFRLNLPVDTETVFARDKFRGKTSFKSSMDVAQHKAMNKFLNDLVWESYRASEASGEPPRIDYSHPHEYDEFYELTDMGRRNLPPSIMAWINPRHTPRVRRTIDEKTNTVKAQIIKSRIADLEVYNPRSDFDYRISISIESPWEGDPNWLTEMTEGGRDRKKDRMSYRHLAYQIDLTQVTYPDTAVKEHELEVEISTEQIRIELASLKASQPNKYEKLVRGFVDNIRILCREGTLQRQAK